MSFTQTFAPHLFNTTYSQQVHKVYILLLMKKATSEKTILQRQYK